MSRLLALAAPFALCLTLCACGAKDPESMLAAGQDQMAAGEYSDALSSFDAVLANSASTDSQKFQASRDRIGALAHVKGGEAAKEAFDAFETANLAKVDIDLLAKVAQDLADANAMDASMELFEIANQKVESITDEAQRTKKKAVLANLSQKLAAAGGSEVTDRLKALGYLN